MTQREQDRLNGDTSAGRWSLFAIVALVLVAGVGLGFFAGPPRLPAELPRPDHLAQLLGGTNLPLDGIALGLVDFAWLVWAWTGLSLLLELLLVVANGVASGREWVRGLHVLADRVSVPLVRRAAAAAFAVELIGRTVSVAAAQPLSPADPVVLASAPLDREADSGAPQTGVGEAMPTYLVRPGDTLWSIAEKAYGSGLQYRLLLDANVGRRMSNGQVFSAQGVIQPGWRLLVPGATWSTDEQDGARWYTVQPGDSLSSIADMLLGDRARWPELFDLNRGASSADGRHMLEDPDTIWPGLRLQVPTAAEPVDEPEPAATPAELAVASAPAAAPGAADPLVAAPGGQTDAIASDVAAARTEDAAADPLPPLVRTPHALQPVVLDAADSADSAESASPDAAPGAPEAAAMPAADAEVSVPPPGDVARKAMEALPWVAGGLGLAGIGVAGLAFGRRRLRRLRPLPQEPESEVVVEGGFAEAQIAHDLTRGLHGVGFDPMAALVAHLQQFLAEYNLNDVDVVAVRHGRSSTTITLRCGLADQPVLLDASSAFADRLEADVEACVSEDQDVVLRLVRLRKTRLLPTADALHTGPCLVPLGVLYDRQSYAAAWGALGHTLIVSLPGHGADTILASLVATLTARRSPEQLRAWLIASPRALPAPLFELPHLEKVVDPTDEHALSEAMGALRLELDRRAALELPVADLLVVVPELASLGEQAASLALLATRATDLGVRLVVASAEPEHAAANPLTPCFATRLVLRMQSEELSVALLGVADAAFLAGGGRLLLRLDGRQPVELYGYRVSAEHLERLVRVMRSAYPSRAPSPRRPSQGPPDAPPAPEPPAAPVRADDPEPAPGLRPDANRGSDDEHDTPAATPPIQVFCLGTPRVLCGDERVWPHGGGGDAKPWELLFFLACQPAEGVLRDAVIEALWRDTQGMAEDANHRFRQLRYRLRRQLQQAANAPSSDGICMDRRGFRLDPAIVHSDAQEFLNLVREGRLHADPDSPDAIRSLERARCLYAGDLLDGPDARRYAWVDERDDSGVTLREHFRRLFQNACMRLAEAYSSTGRIADAIDVYHDLTDMDPSDERLFQALFRLHAEIGDELGLQAEERRMRQLLQELSAELDAMDAQAAEPDQETMQEYRRLLASVRARKQEPAAV